MIIENFPAVAQTLFAGLPVEVRSQGSAILVAGAESAEKTLYGSKARTIKFHSPDFAAQEVPYKQWTSIGSGIGVSAYQAELEKVNGDEADALLQMEIGGPGGHAQMMGRIVAMEVWALPVVPGISKHFHIGVAFANELWITNSDREDFPTDGPPQQIRMPPVASSLVELKAMLRGRVAVSDLSTAVA